MNKYILSALCMLMLTGCLDSKGYNTASTNTTTASHTISDLAAIPHDEAIVLTFGHEPHSPAHEVVFTIEVAKASFANVADTTTSQAALTDVITLTTHANRTTITGLANGTTYYVRVRATEDGYAPSLWSDEVQTTPRIPTPTDIIATTQSMAVQLAWQWSGVGTPTFIIHQAHESLRQHDTLNDAAGYTTHETTRQTLHIDNLTNDQVYHFAIHAEKDGKQGGLSDEIKAIPTPPTARVPSLTVLADNQAIWVEISPEADTTHTLYYSNAHFSTTDGLEGYVLANDSTVVRGLENDATYYAAAIAHKVGHIDSALSMPIAATPRDLTPKSLAATADNQRVRLNWEAIDGASTYTVYYEHKGIAITETTQTNFFVATNLNNRAPYAFSVTADKDGFKESAKSAEVSAILLNLTPQGLSVIADNQQAHLSWMASADAANMAGVTYTVFKNGEAITGANNIQGSTHTVSSLANEQTYTFTVRADKDGYEQSTASNAATATPLNLTPQNFTATADNQTVRLAWNPVAGTSHYTVYQTVDGQTTTEIANTNAFTAKDLTNGTEYSYAITAHKQGYKESSQSDEKTATPLNLTPQGLSVIADNKQARLIWEASSDAANMEGVTYTVLQDGVAITGEAGIQALTYTVDNLTNGQAYTFTVRTDKYGYEQSAASNEINATPLDLMPKSLTATADNGAVELRWDAPSIGAGYSEGITYTVLQDGVAITGEAGIQALTYTVDNLTNGQAYTFTVRADKYGYEQSAASNEINATPLDLTPQNLTATAGDEDAEVDWQALDNTTYCITVNAEHGGTKTHTAKASPYTITNLINGTTYTVSVIADKAGYKPSAYSSLSVTSITPAPTSLTAEPTLQGAHLEWQSTAKNAAFIVHYATASLEGKKVSEYSTLEGYSTKQTTTTMADIKGLEANVSYYFVVVATKGGGHADSAPSSEATAIPSDKIPTDKPEGVSATAGNGVVTLQWNAVNLDGTITYTVFKDGAPIAAAMDIEALTYTVSDLANG